MAANKLKVILDDIGWTQADLARKSGISAGSINKFYLQSRTPSPATQAKLANTISEVKKITRQELFENE